MFIADLSKIQSIHSFFENLGPQFNLFFSTQKGTFVPGSVYTISQALDVLLKKGILYPNQTFLDAGSGDVRILALASLLCFKTYGIEYNEEIYNSSLLNLICLQEQRLQGLKPYLALGDFLDLGPYTQFGVPFSFFKIIFNFATFPDEIDNKIISESKLDTIFKLYTVNSCSPDYTGLDLVLSLILPGVNQYLYVYRK